MKYTLVITTYNSISTIERVLENIRKLNHRPDEVIIIDDASDDGSIGLINSLISRYPDYRLILNRTNQGQSYSRNLGVNLASNEFVIFQDDDDISLPNRAAGHLEAFNLGADFSYLSSTKRYPNGYVVVNENSNFTCDQSRRLLVIKHLSVGSPLPDNLKLFSPSSTLAIRKSFFEKIGGFNQEMRRLEDIELACRALSNEGTLSWSDQIGVERLHTEGSDKSAMANYLGEEQVITSVRNVLSSREYFVARKSILLREAYFSRSLKKIAFKGLYAPLILFLSPGKMISFLRRIKHDLRQRI